VEPYRDLPGPPPPHRLRIFDEPVRHPVADPVRRRDHSR
jgi:hypothetical protein